MKFVKNVFALLGISLALSVFSACQSSLPAEPSEVVLEPMKVAEFTHISLLAKSSHGSDGTDRARDGKPRFLGLLGARGVTHNGYQYVVYYTGKDRSLGENQSHANVIIARRKVGGVDWEKSTLQGYKVTSDDAHNRQSIGISGDGVIHISFDHHNDPVLNYAKTLKGVANNPDSIKWDDSVFTYAPNFDQDLLASGTEVTYPNFTQFPDGGLILYFRDGGSYAGEMHLARYDPKLSKWAFVRKVSSRFGSYEGLETTRGPYTAGGMQVSHTGELKVAWLFRERPCVGVKPTIHYEHFCNHGLYYASSPNEGKTWYHADGRLIADTSKGEAISIANVAPEVVKIPKELAPSNVAITSTVDKASGDMHVLLAHMSSTSSNEHTMYHYIGTTDGKWTRERSNFSASGAKLIMHGEYLLAFEGRRNAAIYYADRKNNFMEWKKIQLGGKFEGGDFDVSGGYISWDLSRMAKEGMASVLWHTDPESKRDGDPSPIYVADLKVLGKTAVNGG